MTELELVEKICTRCGESKPGSEFTRRANGRLIARCKPCMTVVVREAKARRRAELGEEEYLRHEREKTRRSRVWRGYDTETAYRQARRKAIQALIAAHSKEFEALFRRAKYEAGLL